MLTSYDPAACADRCTAQHRCNAFNICISQRLPLVSNRAGADSCLKTSNVPQQLRLARRMVVPIQAQRPTSNAFSGAVPSARPLPGTTVNTVPASMSWSPVCSDSYVPTMNEYLHPPCFQDQTCTSSKTREQILQSSGSMDHVVARVLKRSSRRFLWSLSTTIRQRLACFATPTRSVPANTATIPLYVRKNATSSQSITASTKSMQLRT